MAMRSVREFVTPEKAAKYLKKNPNNRRLDVNRVKQYANEMTRGQWAETHQGIALNCDGSLKDGQHRLHAIVQSGIGQWFFVFRGLSDEAMPLIDIGRLRSISDVMTIDGRPVSRNAVAVGRMMMSPDISDWRANRLDVIAFIERHHEAIEFAVHELTFGPAKCAPVLASIGRAWYTRDRARLKEFARCLKTGIVSCREDTAAVTLYRFLNAGGNLGVKERIVLYKKTCSALLAFLESRPLSKLYAVESDPFSIPE
jgi:hypothetical protein